MFRCPNGARDPVDYKPIVVTPGLDTTMNLSFEVSLCTQPPGGASAAPPPITGVSSIPHWPSSAQRFRWMYLTPIWKPGFWTCTTTCLDLMPGKEKYPPDEVVARAITESGALPLLIVTLAPGTARLLVAVTRPLTVRGEVDSRERT